MIARPATVASERKTRTSLGGSLCLVETIARRRCAARLHASEAQVDLADDERRGADVDPVVVAV